MLRGRSIAYQSIVAFIIKIMAGASGYLMFSLLSRVLGGDKFGEFGIAFSLAMFLGLLAGFGQQLFIVKQVAIARSRNDINEEKGVLVYSIQTTLASSLFSSILFAVIAKFLLDIQNSLYIIMGSGIVFMFGITQTTIGFYRIKDSVLQGIFTRDLIWRILIIIGILLLSFIGVKFDLSIAMGVFVASLFIPFLIHIAFARDVILDIKSVNKKADLKPWVQVSFVFAMIALVSGSDMYLITIFMRGYVSNIEVGAFFASFKTVELINMFLMSVSLISAPKLANLFAEKKYQELQRQCNLMLIIQSIPSFTCCLIIVLFPSFFLSIFDPVYHEYGILLAILSLGMLFNSLTGSTALLLQLGNMHWRHLYYQGGSLVLILLMLPALIDWFGVAGGALGFVFSKIIWNILAILEIRKRYGVDPSVLGFFVNKEYGLRVAINDLIAQLRHKRTGA